MLAEARALRDALHARERSTSGPRAVSLRAKPGGRRREGDEQPRPGTMAIRTGPAPNSDPAEAQAAGTILPSSAEPSTSPSSAATAPTEREAKRAPAVAPGDAAVASGTARAFLAGYLPYSYGHAQARTIRRATDRLLRELEVSTPRVPATVARARPRLVSVHAEAALGDHAIDVVAVVDDGYRRYGLPLELQRTGGRWQVTAVGG